MFSVFSPNAEKYGPECLQTQTLFTQWLPMERFELVTLACLYTRYQNFRPILTIVKIYVVATKMLEINFTLVVNFKKVCLFTNKNLQLVLGQQQVALSKRLLLTNFSIIVGRFRNFCWLAAAVNKRKFPKFQLKPLEGINWNFGKIISLKCSHFLLHSFILSFMFIFLFVCKYILKISCMF